MKLQKTPLEDCYVIEPTVFEDERGYFYEKYNQQKFEEISGLDGDFVQDNISRSNFGVLRGIHFQRGGNAQAKLVSCLEGAVWDVAVDLRKNSATFGKWFGIELNAENKLQLFVPRGFGHGFSVISEAAIFAYKCDNYYNKASESGIMYNDEDLNIDWKLAEKDIIISEKDQILPFFKEDKFL